MSKGAATMEHIDLYAEDCPDGPDRVARDGDVKLVMWIRLADGRQANLHCGLRTVRDLRRLLNVAGDLDP